MTSKMSKCEALLELLPVHSPDKMNEAEGNGRMLDRFRSTSLLASIVRSNWFEPLVFIHTSQNPTKKAQDSDKKRGNRFLNNIYPSQFFKQKPGTGWTDSQYLPQKSTLSPSDLASLDGPRKTTG